jgi:Fe2+ or Zn2+ uptake regulation protein
MERLTNQKQVIIDYLKNIKTHPSAEEVYLNVKKKLPRISQGTVYRILKNFKEKGEVCELNTNVSHFDADISPHGHFMCEKCNKIYDLFGKFCKFDCKHLKIGKVKNYQIHLYGVCKKCQKIK